MAGRATPPGDTPPPEAAAAAAAADYHPLPASEDQNDAVLSDHSSFRLRRIIVSIFLISFASILVYILWPSDPRINIVRLRIAHIHVHRWPVLSIDMSLRVMLKVSNANVYSFDYTSLNVAIAYRGKTLGHVTSVGGQVTAMGSSYVEAETDLDGVAVLPDVFYLLHDLAKGSVEFDTVTATNGQLGLLFFRVPLKVLVYFCGYTPMDIRNLCNSGAENTSHSKTGYDRINLSVEMLSSRSKMSKLRLMLRKMMREKKRALFWASPARVRVRVRVNVCYDPRSYSQNFERDVVSDRDDPDVVSRSFSARFAVPSRVFETADLLII